MRERKGQDWSFHICCKQALPRVVQRMGWLAGWEAAGTAPRVLTQLHAASLVMRGLGPIEPLFCSLTSGRECVRQGGCHTNLHLPPVIKIRPKLLPRNGMAAVGF
jgi:hypothetical protein